LTQQDDISLLLFLRFTGNQVSISPFCCQFLHRATIHSVNCACCLLILIIVVWSGCIALISSSCAYGFFGMSKWWMESGQSPFLFSKFISSFFHPVGESFQLHFQVTYMPVITCTLDLPKETKGAHVVNFGWTDFFVNQTLFYSLVLYMGMSMDHVLRTMWISIPYAYWEWVGQVCLEGHHIMKIITKYNANTKIQPWRLNFGGWGWWWGFKSTASILLFEINVNIYISVVEYNTHQCPATCLQHNCDTM